MLDARPPFTAVLAFDDLTALGVVADLPKRVCGYPKTVR